MKPPGPTERYWMPGSASLDWEGALVKSGRRASAAGSRGSVVAGAGFGAAAGLAAFGAGAALAFFSFSSPGFTGEGRDSRPSRWALPIPALRRARAGAG